MGSGTWATWVVLAIVGFIVYKVVQNVGAGAAKHCMTCGTEGPTTARTRGSILIEIVLWLCFIIPGLVYSLWRLTTRRQVCKACGAENVVPLNTPAAARHRKTLQQG